MSRIGSLKIDVPDSVQIVFEGGKIQVKGPKGTLSDVFKNVVDIKQENKSLQVIINDTNDNVGKVGAFSGLYHVLLNNMIIGVTKGFEMKLELIGVGYKANMISSNVLELSLGHSHKTLFVIPSGITCTVQAEKGKNIIVSVVGTSKCLVGQIASNIRMLRPVEPYKGKGFRYFGEEVHLKAGKTVASKK